ncbi:transposase [Streptomyces sp. NPDC058745]|uniref:IS110 family transposase n=1 Tax=Streptomyces sp. NPDC058745 TaxID=3346621 RepID=UPI0036997F16
MDVFCGIDWAEGHHDVALVDDTGKLLAKCRINDDLDGYRLLLDLLAEDGDTAETPIPVAIETSRGLLVATLRQGPRKIYAVKRRYVGRRFVKNNRLNHVGHLWAFASLSGSSGADSHYRRRRAGGDWHMQALRHLFNRMLGQLHHCLQTRTPFDETVAFPLGAMPVPTQAVADI